MQKKNKNKCLASQLLVTSIVEFMKFMAFGFGVPPQDFQ